MKKPLFISILILLVTLSTYAQDNTNLAKEFCEVVETYHHLTEDQKQKLYTMINKELLNSEYVGKDKEKNGTNDFRLYASDHLQRGLIVNQGNDEGRLSSEGFDLAFQWLQLGIKNFINMSPISDSDRQSISQFNDIAAMSIPAAMQEMSQGLTSAQVSKFTEEIKIAIQNEKNNPNFANYFCYSRRFGVPQEYLDGKKVKEGFLESFTPGSVNYESYQTQLKQLVGLFSKENVSDVTKKMMFDSFIDVQKQQIVVIIARYQDQVSTPEEISGYLMPSEELQRKTSEFTANLAKLNSQRNKRLMKKAEVDAALAEILPRGLLHLDDPKYLNGPPYLEMELNDMSEIESTLKLKVSANNNSNLNPESDKMTGITKVGANRSDGLKETLKSSVKCLILLALLCLMSYIFLNIFKSKCNS